MIVCLHNMPLFINLSLFFGCKDTKSVRILQLFWGILISDSFNAYLYSRTICVFTHFFRCKGRQLTKCFSGGNKLFLRWKQSVSWAETLFYALKKRGETAMVSPLFHSFYPCICISRSSSCWRGDRVAGSVTL